MKNLSKKQKLTFEFDEIESIEDVGYKECIDIEVADDNSFTLSNGVIVHNSAKAGLSEGLGRKEIGYFSTRGVPLNAYEAEPSKIADNEELTNIIKCLNLKLGAKEQNMTYENVLLASDQDCFHESTFVLTKRGNIQLKDIQYGDEVLTHTGEWKKVVEIIEKYKTDIIKVEINGEYLYMSENHQLPVVRNGKIEIIKAKDLLTTDMLLKKKC